jgi:hypothetical protein
MTARRRRKLGSGPSATALIAWVGGARTAIGAPAVAPVPMIGGASTDRTVSGRALFLGRACGLAAGTLLACGSVLAGATHVGDGSVGGDSASLRNSIPPTPDVPAGAPGEYRADPSAEPVSAAPDVVSVQSVAEQSSRLHRPLGSVRRNAPVSVAVPDEPNQNPRTAGQPWQSSPPASGPAPQTPVKPISPVLDPAANGVGRVAPVGEVLAPTTPSAPTTLGAQTAPGAQATPRPVLADSPREERTKTTWKSRASTSRNKRTDFTRGAPAETVKKPAETVKKVVAPVGNAINQSIRPVMKPAVQPATRPAMAMLTSVLSIN